jgi:hypothetical protein
MSSQHNSPTIEDFNKLIQFRQAAYLTFEQARDALFELVDAILQMPRVQSFAELSCAPAFRRKWPSVYEALQDGRLQRDQLLKLYLKQLPEDERLVLVGDHTAWPRIWAATLSERSYQHAPDPIPGRRPVTIGHGYSSLVVVPPKSGSWALPLLHERITDQKPVLKGAEQLRQVCQALKVRPLSIWDAEYGCASFLKATADIPADKLFRLRSNLSLEGPPKPYKGRGPHPKHGLKLNFKDPTTWWQPDEAFEIQDEDFGPLKVRIWKGLRFRQALEVPLWVALIERLQGPDTRRKPRLLWLGWAGEDPASRWWGQYAQRYPVDHWYRFIKGRFHWTTPLLSTPEQGERWSDLMPFATWQLWLARPLVSDHPLPWQKAQAHLTPGRVGQSIAAVFSRIGTPTLAPKPRGISPGWPSGKPRQPRKRHDLIRSEQWKRIREHRAAKNAQSTA